MSHDPKNPPTPRLPIRPITERGGGGGDDDRYKRVEAETDITANYEGAARKPQRPLRTTEKRLDHLEDFQDDVDARLDSFKDEMNTRFSKMEIVVADVGGQMKILPKLVETMEKATDALRQHAHVKFTAEVDVNKQKQISEIKVGEAKEIGDVEVKKVKWNIVLKIGAAGAALWTTISTVLMAKGC